MERRPMPGELYRHFKGGMYQIITVARHSETGEELVVYQAMYGDYGTYARPLGMFVSEVDREKYPDEEQKYRFVRVSRDVGKSGLGDGGGRLQKEEEPGDGGVAGKLTGPENGSGAEEPGGGGAAGKPSGPGNGSRAEEPGDGGAAGKLSGPGNGSRAVGEPQAEPELAGAKAHPSAEASAPEGGVHPKLMEFLEADGMEERYNILVSMRDVVTNGMIDTMAVVVDVVIPEGDVTERYDDLKRVIRTRQQYEFANRLR